MTGLAAPADPGTSAAPADDPITAAGKDFLASLTPDQLNRPLTGPDDDDDGAPAVAAPAPAEAAIDIGEPITRDDGADWNDEAQRWQLNGKFVAGAAPEGWEAPAKPAPAPATGTPAVAAPAPVAAPADSEPTGVKVTLPGLSERGEEDIEVEVDKDLADRIQQLKTDAGRSRALQRRTTQLDQREAALESYEQEMTVDPIGFHLNKMPRDQQLEVARALLVEHMDDLSPDIEQLRDPNIRLAATKQLRDGLRTSQDRVATARHVSAMVRDVVRAVEALVPEGTDDAIADLFIADARRDLANAADAKQPVTPQNAKALLARRLTLYGFDKPMPSTARPAAAPAPGAPAVPTARPVSDRARAIAAQRPATGDAAAAQARIRRTQGNRAAAARVAPVGAGAAPTQTIALPPEAETDIKAMSKYLLTQGLPQTWGAGRE